MGAHKFFCPKDNLEKILNFEEEHQTIYNIVNQFCDLVLDVDEQDVIDEIEANPMMKSLFKRDSCGIIADKKLYESLNSKEYQYFLNDIIIIENDEGLIDELRNEYGILALKLDDDFLESQNFHFGYSIGPYKDSLKCWSELFRKNKIRPINSAILIDNFLWSNPSDYERENKDNIYPILENLIPKKLKIPFHLIIVVQNGKGLLKKEKAKEIIIEMNKNLFRKSGLLITIVTQTDTRTFHERMILTNYHYIPSDKGFATFRNGRVRNNTKGSRDWVFKDINNYIGEINKHEHQRSALNVSKLVRKNSRGDDNDVIFCEGDMDSPILSNFN